ncbi:MAG: hypothetical protein ACO398_09625 [Kiritimatiellia bacterium]
MASRALVIINIGQQESAELARDLMQRYCRREGYDFVELREPKLKIAVPGVQYSFANLEKFQLYDVLGTYERVLRLDTDVLVSPLAPDVFREVPEEALGVVYEDVGEKVHTRREQMNRIATERGGEPWGARRYFNSGVMVCSRVHRDMFKLDDEDMAALHSGGMGGFKEQNLCNWKARALGYPLHDLDYRFNHQRFFSDPEFGGHDRFNSFFLHYAGGKRKRSRRMKRDRAALLRAWEGGSSPRLTLGDHVRSLF